MNLRALVAVMCFVELIWLMFIWGGSVYLIGWKEWSPWWFIVTLMLSALSPVNYKVGSVNDG